MNLLAALLLLLGLYPLSQALRANRTTTLRQALLWALLAWLAWSGVAWARVRRPEIPRAVAAYGALCLSGCAGVAVLGARRPGVSAWNFVLVGLLAVLLLPILNGRGTLRLESAPGFFLMTTLAISFINYLPTRLGLGAVLAAAGCGVEMSRLMAWTAPREMPWLSLLLLASAPWAAWAGVARQNAKATAFQRLWLAYRDRFGLVWAVRMREQFNRAAHHAGWPLVLGWSGLHPTAESPVPDSAQQLATLHAILKRFGQAEDTQGGIAP